MTSVRRRALFVLALAFACVARGEKPPAALKADKIVVLKSERKLMLLERGRVVKTYRISLGGEPVGSKIRQGDHRTPEGVYVIDRRNAHSQFHKSLHISYPNAEDRARARRLGVSPGGDIFVHGLPNGYHWLGPVQHLDDWTDGCIAVTNGEIDELVRAAPPGTIVVILP